MVTTTQRSHARAKVRTRRPGEARRAAAALDAQLDQALADTFPASDPVAVGHPTGTEAPTQPVDRQGPAVD